ncbi:MAG: hypothetical protein PHV91_04330 [Bacteroidales bacterium]|jgi:hypothetical protein|nr:hypothetical protein [Bacteroidales bacterium]
MGAIDPEAPLTGRAAGPGSTSHLFSHVFDNVGVKREVFAL